MFYALVCFLTKKVERALDNARLEVEAQQNTIAHLKAELTERREHERLNQHSIALMDAKMNEKVLTTPASTQVSRTRGKFRS